MPFDGLSPIVCGVLGYVSIILYDLNNVTHNNDLMPSLYTVGAGLIGLAFLSTGLLLVPAANLDPWYATIFSVCGLLLAMYEDINVFPVLMRGYNAYKDTTPFLFPTKESIRRCFKGKKAR